jgi:hypothetical protein
MRYQEIVEATAGGEPFADQGLILDKHGQEYTVDHSRGVNNEHVFTVMDGDVRAAYVRLSHTGEYVVDLDVGGRWNPEYRRRGIATAMYDYIERGLGYRLQPSPTWRTDDGKAFWASRGEKIQMPFDVE